MTELTNTTSLKTDTRSKSPFSSPLNLFRAEWRKMNGHRFPSIMLMWVYPIGAVLVSLIYQIIVLTSPRTRATLAEVDGNWLEIAAFAWALPATQLVRLMIVGFTATMFAGEYQWGTWKSIIPRNRRANLILNKLAVLVTQSAITFTLTSLVAIIGIGMVVTSAGGTYGPPVTPELLSGVAEPLLLMGISGMLHIVIAIAYAILGAILTRSVLGSVLLSFFLIIMEAAFLGVLLLAENFLQLEGIVVLYRYTIGYNLQNIQSWAMNGSAFSAPFLQSAGIGADTLSFSLVFVGIWLVGLIAAVVFLFRRQDIMG
jgi:ABC-type transport system involved in multi-copper enzyme maturation permease subunit